MPTTPTEYYTSIYSGEEIDAAISKIKNITGADIPVSVEDDTDLAAALSKKAPGGYGLGEHVGKAVPDCNEAVVGGWYQIGAGSLNTPDLIPNHQYATLLVVPRNTYLTQLYYNTVATCYMAVRIKSESGWKPWEYVNPPMTPGVEYRTTERYNGKPVYVKLVNCGAIADGKTVAHGIENPNYIIRFEGIRAGKAIPQIYQKNLSNTRTVYVTAVDATNIELTCGDSAAGTQCYVTLWYTKTTD